MIYIKVTLLIIIMITFKINNNNNIHEIQATNNDSIIGIKNKIITTLNLQAKYIDLFYLIDRPIRGIGKFTIENGISPRTMDNNLLSDYNLDNKEIVVSYKIVDDYKEHIHRPTLIKRYYKNTGSNESNNNLSENPIYNLDSEIDFPKIE